MRSRCEIYEASRVAARSIHRQRHYRSAECRQTALLKGLVPPERAEWRFNHSLPPGTATLTRARLAAQAPASLCAHCGLSGALVVGLAAAISNGRRRSRFHSQTIDRGRPRPAKCWRCDECGARRRGSGGSRRLRARLQRRTRRLRPRACRCGSDGAGRIGAFSSFLSPQSSPSVPPSVETSVHFLVTEVSPILFPRSAPAVVHVLTPTLGSSLYTVLCSTKRPRGGQLFLRPGAPLSLTSHDHLRPVPCPIQPLPLAFSNPPPTTQLASFLPALLAFILAITGLQRRLPLRASGRLLPGQPSTGIGRSERLLGERGSGKGGEGGGSAR